MAGAHHPAAGRVCLRPATFADAGEVAAVHVRADRETYGPIFGGHFRPADAARSRSRWETALTAGDVVLLVVDADRIVGFAQASESWLGALYLLASHQRRGLGARLLGEVCARLRDRGVGEIGFQVVAANGGAVAFYEAMGACPVGRRTEGEGEAAWEDIIFRLPTDSAALRGA